MSLSELWRLDATEQASLVRSGEVTATELVQHALTRIETLDPRLGAVVDLAADAALERAASVATGPFAGVPFLAKDLLPYPGLRAAMGCRLFAGNVPATHVPYTQRIDDCGLVCLGKTATSELGLLGSTETMLEGVTRNPWGPDLSAGGSSGGAATAVAAGLVPLAHASDGGGSIRLPAALAGLFGFKPSAGATVPATPVANDFVRLTSEHCISRSVRDSATFLAATAPTPADPVRPGPLEPLRIGLYSVSAFGVPATAEARAAVEHAAAVCTQLGHRVEEVSPPLIRGEAISRAFFTVAGSAIAGMRQMLAPMLGRALAPEDVEPFTWKLVTWFDTLGPGAVEQALADLEAQGAAMRVFLDSVDVALCPTVGGARPALGHLAPHLPMDTLLRRTELFAGFTAVHNPTGAPAMSVPLHQTDADLPVGCQFAASPGEDARLLRLAYQLEEAAPWSGQWPPGAC